MNNEPVAWMSKEDFENKDKAIWTLFKIRYEKKYDYTVPLYTHPAKTLTDEDLIEDLTHFVEKLHRRWGDDLWIDATDLMAVEKAIESLRKAQK